MSRQFYRRLAGHLPQLVGRLRDAVGRVSNDKGTPRDAARAISDAWDAVAAELQSFLAALSSSNDSGLPSGSAAESGVTPTTVEAGTSSSIGSAEDGWAAARHQHGVLTASAVDLIQEASNEGSGAALARAAHGHQMLIQAERDGADIGTVSAVDINGPGLSVAIEPNLAGSLSDMYAYWPFDEVSGDCRKKLGSAASADFSEVGGVVARSAGKFDGAIESAYTSAAYLETACTPVALSAGFTFATWFTSHSENAGGGSHVYQNLAIFYSGTDYIRIVRHRTVGAGTAGWMQAYSYIGGVTTNGMGNIALIASRDIWHLLIVWVDPITQKMWLSIDDGAPVVGTLYTGLTDLSGFTLDKIQIAVPSTWDAWDGKIDAPVVWPRILTAAERSRLLVSRRASVKSKIRYAPHFLFGGR